MIMKKIFDGVFDEEVHTDFLRFGRGLYENKYMLEGKKQAKKWSVKASFEYANMLVRRCMETVDGEIKVKGVIVSTQRLEGDKKRIDFVKVSNFQGVRKHLVDCIVSPEKVFEMMDKYPKAFFALSFSGEGFVLKIKPKAPTSGKPGKEDEDGPSIDFCSLKTEDKALVDELFFGVGDFTEVTVKHTINVTDIVYPSNMSELKPAEIRAQAKRKGVLKRIVIKDGQESATETNFVA